MRPLVPGIDGIRQYDCYGNRTDSTTPIVADSESLVVLTEDDKILIAAAMKIAVSARHNVVSAERDTNPQFDGSSLDAANTKLVDDLLRFGSQMESLLPTTEDAIDRAISLRLFANQEQSN